MASPMKSAVRFCQAFILAWLMFFTVCAVFSTVFGAVYLLYFAAAYVDPRLQQITDSLLVMPLIVGTIGGVIMGTRFLYDGGIEDTIEDGRRFFSTPLKSVGLFFFG